MFSIYISSLTIPRDAAVVVCVSQQLCGADGVLDRHVVDGQKSIARLQGTTPVGCTRRSQTFYIDAARCFAHRQTQLTCNCTSATTN